MTAKILQLCPGLTYEAAQEAYHQHFEECKAQGGCTDKELCPQGLSLNYMAWALMCPPPRPWRRSSRVTAGRRRSSSFRTTVIEKAGITTPARSMRTAESWMWIGWGLLVLYGPDGDEPLTAYHETQELRSFEGRVP